MVISNVCILEPKCSNPCKLLLKRQEWLDDGEAAYLHVYALLAHYTQM